MQITVDDLSNGIRKISLQGRMDLEGTNEISGKLTAHAATGEKSSIICDLSLLEFIASIGLGTLVTNAKAARRRGGNLVLVNPQPIVAKVLATTGIDKIIPVYDNYDAAVAALLA